LKEEEIERVLGDRELDTGCLPNPGSCGNSRKYRTIDGTCNHVENKLRNLGRSVSGFRRLLKPVYGDGKNLNLAINPKCTILKVIFGLFSNFGWVFLKLYA